MIGTFVRGISAIPTETLWLMELLDDSLAGSLKGKKCVRVWIRVNCARNISANG